MPVILDGTHLTPGQLVDVVDGGAGVRIDPSARARAAASQQTALRVAARRPVYGRTTGVGANHGVALESDQALEPDQPTRKPITDETQSSAAPGEAPAAPRPMHPAPGEAPAAPGALAESAGLRLIRSHAGGAGERLSARHVRAMMVVRANQLLAGAAGVDPALIEAIVAAINAGTYPAVHEFGSVGTGDLTALSELALALIGEREWCRPPVAGGAAMPNRPNPTAAAPVGLASADALALVSSSAATIAQAALAYSQLQRLARAGSTVAALSFVALQGSLEAYAPQVHAGRPHPGSVAAAARLRELVEPAPAPSVRIQDPYALRAFPQLQGVLLDALARVRDILVIELNAAAENPFVSIDAGDVFHHGGFHQAPLSLALDALRLALLSNAQLNTARIAALVEPRLTGLTPFLASGPPGSSGVLICEYTAASALAAIRASAMPVAFGTAVLSRGVEEHASFAAQAARQTGEAATRYRVVLAAELLCAVRALRLSGRRPSSPELAAAFAKAAAGLPDAMQDRPLDGDLEIAAAQLDELA